MLTSNSAMNLSSRTIVLLATALAALGCASLRPPLTAPDQGGPPWIELTSQHFVLETDVDLPSARAVVADFEQSYAALAYVMQRPKEEATGKFELVLFDRDADFHEACGQDRTKGAYFTAQLDADVEPHPVMVMRHELLDEETRNTFLHELT